MTTRAGWTRRMGLGRAACLGIDPLARLVWVVDDVLIQDLTVIAGETWGMRPPVPLLGPPPASGGLLLWCAAVARTGKGGGCACHGADGGTRGSSSKKKVGEGPRVRRCGEGAEKREDVHRSSSV